MLAVGVDAAEDRLIVEHHSAIELADVEVEGLAGRTDADQTYDAAGRCAAEHVAHDDRRARALHDDIGLEAVEIGRLAQVESAAELANDQSLFLALAIVEHMNFQPSLGSDECREQADRASAGHQERSRLPTARTAADAFGVIPRLGNHARRLDQYAFGAERLIELDEKFRLDAEKIRAKTVPLLDAALGVKAVAAHVPLSDRAGRTRNGIGPAHNAYDKIANVEAATGRRFLHSSQRLVADHQPLLTRRRPAIRAAHNFSVGPADSQRQRAHQHRTVGSRWVSYLFDACGIGYVWRDGEGTHYSVPRLIRSFDRGYEVDVARSP